MIFIRTMRKREVGGVLITLAWALAITLIAWMAALNKPAHAQMGGPLPPSAYISNTATTADTGGFTLNLPSAAPPGTGRIVYVCGIFVGGLGATSATNVSASFSTLTGTLAFTYTMPAGATVPAAPLQVTFTPCLPSSTSNSQVSLIVGGAAGNTTTTASIWGYMQ